MAENEIITADGEIITGPATEQTSLAIGLTRAEIDQQIATAHAFPRSIAKSSKSIFELVTIDEQSAEECNYALPRGGKPITGPSIRLAEIIAGQWGNCRVGARVVHVDRAEKYVEAEGVFHDLETNAATTARVRRRIVDRNGKLYNDDMIIVTGNAACSIAKRNAILSAVPKAVWRKAYDAALATIKGDIKTLSERRDKMLKAFSAFGVKPEQIFAAIEVGGLEDINLDHIGLLAGMHAALKSGEATVEEMFAVAPAAGSAGGEKKNLKGKLDDIAGGKKAKGGEQPADDAGKKQKEANKPAASGKPTEKPEGPNTGAGDARDDDDGFPGDTPAPSSDEIEAARDRGATAYHSGMSRKALPGEYKDVAALAEAWLAAYDEAKDEEEGGDQS
ncbi:hypothetical protein SAMN05892877_103393 [Rhizobium subbaraonis]|uniref:Uncharacterized protein n=1 Tax=Rhizobium subbaraonis TaxID=908946 RepID=A0A285U5E1_9HYPH|nr:hypothetical protein [Rhizobium subbaraonis]SOC37049.1 hypothetical protein SAMN05892877_103393 [Rhizobium subbaraonis]